MSEENKERETQEVNAQEHVEQKDQTTVESQNEAKGDTNISIDGNVAKKIVYSLCYLWGILFFLPLILYKDDPAAKMHANEGLLLLLLAVVGNVVFGVLSSVFGWVFGMLAGIYSLLLFILGLIGIIYIVTDKTQPLPLIGAIQLIK